MEKEDAEFLFQVLNLPSQRWLRQMQLRSRSGEIERIGRFCAENSLRAVAYSRGVVRVLGAGDRPIPVEDSIIASIRARMAADGCVELEEHRFGASDCVRITSGPLAGWSGVFERELTDSQRVVILIETLQQGRVVISRDLVELADAA